MAVETGWIPIVGGIDKGENVEVKLDTAFGNIDAAIVQLNINTDNILAITNSYINRDGSIPFSKATFDTLASAPAYAESSLYYKDGVLNLQGEYSDVTLQIGQEMHLKVINNTGVTINNGQVVRQNGVSNGQIQITLAQADTFSNARILGMVTHEILDGTTGIVTTSGIVNDIDTSGLALGQPTFLSDTIAGALTSIAPDIATQVGGVRVIDATNGVFQVKSVSNINIPNTIGILNGQTLGNETYSVTATPQAIVNYNNEGNIVMPTDILLGTITPVIDGFYRATLNASYSFSSLASTRSLDFSIYNKTDAVILDTITKNIPRDAVNDGISISPALQLLANKEYQVIISSTTGNIDITFDSIIFDIESIHIR